MKKAKNYGYVLYPEIGKLYKKCHKDMIETTYDGTPCVTDMKTLEPLKRYQAHDVFDLIGCCIVWNVEKEYATKIDKLLFDTRRDWYLQQIREGKFKVFGASWDLNPDCPRLNSVAIATGRIDEYDRVEWEPLP